VPSPFNTTILTGDALGVRRSGILGDIITFFTGGDRSHAMTAVEERHIREAYDAGWLVVRREHEPILNEAPDPERIWCASADADGLWASPLEEWVAAGYKIRVRRIPDVYAGEPVHLPEGWRDRLGDLAARVCGLWGYSYRYLLANAEYAIFGAPTIDPADIDAMTDEQLERTYRRFMCSQSTSFFIRRCALWDPCEEADRATTPNGLDRTTRLVTICDELAFVARGIARRRRARWMPCC